MKLRLGTLAIAVGLGAFVLVPSGAGAAAPAGKGHHHGKRTTLVVCKRGCDFRSIQAAVDDVKRGKRAVIKVKPGTYREGVQVIGHRYDGLRIVGTAKNPRRVILEGKNAHLHKRVPIAQNGIEGLNVDGLTLKNMWARNYATNGFFVHADPGHHCRGFLMKNVLASFNRSYGLFAKHCVGGRMTRSAAWGQGDSGFYIGETPRQSAGKRKWTELDHLDAYKNVLGYSGTNSKYVDIHDSRFFNNGAGVVPNTLDSELFEPAATGRVHDNKIFWNNMNYYKPSSPVKTVSGGLGPGGVFSYPTGIGVVLFGTDGWVVRDNKIFGNFMWGAASFSDPFNDGHDALNENNRLVDNKMGRGGTDKNRFDFFNDGSGSGNCFSGNSSSSFEINATADHGQAFLYPSCPAPPSAGTGTDQGDGYLDHGQVGELAAYVASSPPCSQEDSWVKHPHPPFEGLKPFTVGGPCPAP